MGSMLALASAGCGLRDAAPDHPPDLRLVPSPSPYTRVEAGGVRAMVPDGWTAIPPASLGVGPEGFIASPDPKDWAAPGRGVGLVATWIDATRVGVPSDYYYLAAHGPILSSVTTAPACELLEQQVFANHVPAVIDGVTGSAGDFVARGDGTCHREGRIATRWAYFVAAPGFGPTHAVGIPRSGLYLVLAVTKDGPEATARLNRLLGHTRFGNAGIRDFVAALRLPSPA